MEGVGNRAGKLEEIGGDGSTWTGVYIFDACTVSELISHLAFQVRGGIRAELLPFWVIGVSNEKIHL